MSSPPRNAANPLTIIAIFAAIVEASALASLPFLKEDSQDLYTWFLVGFPPFLTLLFFVTLNFNYKVLYSPSDYSNEQDFIQIAKGHPATAANPSETLPLPKPPLAAELAPQPPPPTIVEAAAPAPPPAPAPAPAPSKSRPSERRSEFRPLYILDCQHFATDEQLTTTLDTILAPEADTQRHIIILYRAPQLRSPVSALVGRVLSRVLELGNDCTVSAYDLDEAALTTVTRRLTAPPGRPAPSAG